MTADSGNHRRIDYIPAMIRTRTAFIAVIALSFTRYAEAIAAPEKSTPSTTPASKPLSFEQALALAKKNPLARAAYWEWKSSRARLAEARGARWTKISFTSFVGPSPRIECEDVNCTTTSARDVRVDIAGVFGGFDLRLTQPLFTFGKLSSLQNAAQADVERARFKQHAVAGQIAVLVGKAYFGLQLARELGWMLEDGQAQLKKALATIKSDQEKTVGSTITVQDRLRLETLAAEIAARLSEIRAQQATALAGLRALLGRDDADIPNQALVATAYKLRSNANDYARQAEQREPQLQAARAALRGVRALASHERAKYWPDFVAIAGASVARAQGVDDPPSAFANDPFNRTGLQLGLALRWQIDPWRQTARVDRAHAETKRVESLVDAAQRAARMRVDSRYAVATQAFSRLEATRQGDKSARGWVASVVQAEALGTLNPKDLADAYIAYFTMHGRMLESMYQWNIAVIELREATGAYVSARNRQ